MYVQLLTEYQFNNFRYRDGEHSCPRSDDRVECPWCDLDFRPMGLWRRGPKRCFGGRKHEYRNSTLGDNVGIGLALALLACGGAFAQDVSYNSMPGIDFSKYHTYKWITIEGATYPNQIVDTQIKNSIDSQLASKGLTKSDTDKADLYIGYQASINQQRQWNAYGMGGGLRWGGGMATAQSSTISIGTLVLDMSRSCDQAARVDRTRDQDPRPQREPEQETEKSG